MLCQVTQIWSLLSHVTFTLAAMVSLGCHEVNMNAFRLADPELTSNLSMVDFQNMTLGFAHFDKKKCAESCLLENRSENSHFAVAWERTACDSHVCPERLACLCGTPNTSQLHPARHQLCPFPCDERVSIDVKDFWCVRYPLWGVVKQWRVYSVDGDVSDDDEDYENYESFSLDTLPSYPRWSDWMGSFTGVIMGAFIFSIIAIAIIVVVRSKDEPVEEINLTRRNGHEEVRLVGQSDDADFL